jgi:hypothetical protein
MPGMKWHEKGGHMHSAGVPSGPESQTPEKVVDGHCHWCHSVAVSWTPKYKKGAGNRYSLGIFSGQPMQCAEDCDFLNQITEPK